MRNDIIHVLVIEDEKYDVDRIANTLKPYESRIQIKDVVKNGYDALKCIKTKGEYDVVIMDYQISGGLYGEALIKKIKDLDPTLQILVITKMTINQTDPGFANKLLDLFALTNSRKIKWAAKSFMKLNELYLNSFQTRMPSNLTTIYKQKINNLKLKYENI